ncbi:hypothetical protein F511_27039 [Dorcoceras hygrometricum]|uniref:Uncharacterized protein n=1 Tax=Dorcoceras hygrometricum TaxID=472368 RepID=A0A2Z7CTL3_9LAMI|nr:hypothetical protein F511_27039 [Dorcoceras hygrometricum]
MFGCIRAPRDRGEVIARNNTSTPSKCWIRTMIRVDGVWAVEPCVDHWVKIPRPVVLNEVPRQCSYVDTLPTVMDVRRVAKELEAKVTSLEEQVAATRHDLLEYSAQAQQTLNVVTNQLSEQLVAYINGGNDKKGEVVSSSRPQPPPDNQNRDSGIAGGGGDTDRSIVERLMTADRQRQRERSRGHSSGSYKRRRC